MFSAPSAPSNDFFLLTDFPVLACGIVVSRASSQSLHGAE